MTGVALNSDRELIAQGVGNLLSPFFGGIPATAAIARTGVAIKSGAQTRDLVYDPCGCFAVFNAFARACDGANSIKCLGGCFDGDSVAHE